MRRHTTQRSKMRMTPSHRYRATIPHPAAIGAAEEKGEARAAMPVPAATGHLPAMACRGKNGGTTAATKALAAPSLTP